MPERQAALAESIEIIRGVWGPEPFTYHGHYHSTDKERVVPPPLQQPSPPLILAGSGERTALRLVARYADACNFGPGHATGLVRTPDEVRRKNAVLDRYCHEVGRDPRNVLRTHFTSWLMLAPTEAAARAKLDHYYPAGINEEQQFSRVVGTPAQVAAYYQSLVKAGMEYFVVQTLDAADTETIELLAREVIPLVLPATGIVSDACDVVIQRAISELAKETKSPEWTAAEQTELGQNLGKIPVLPSSPRGIERRIDGLVGEHPRHQRDLDGAIAAALTAGAVVREFYDEETAATYAKGDGSPVTDADLPRIRRFVLY